MIWLTIHHRISREDVFMFGPISSLINLGTTNASGTQASQIKITNIASLIACIVPVFYSLYYWLALGAPFAAGLNMIFLVVYAGPLWLTHISKFYAARLWLFLSVMFHTLLLSCVFFTASAGLHFYYLLVPSCLFLLFNEHEKKEKLILMLLGLILFFFCDQYQNTSPLVTLTQTTEKLLFSSTILVVMLETFLVTFIFARAVSRNEKRLKTMAARDPLTNLNNRRSFVDIGEVLLSSALRYKKPLCLLLLDVDHFKKVNDQYGHVAGDVVLKEIASVLQSGLRGSDLLARYGGEEFVIMLPETDAQAGSDVANILKQKIEDREINISAGTNINCTASFGIVEVSDSISTLNGLTEAADKALYKAKSDGRNQVRVYMATVKPR